MSARSDKTMNDLVTFLKEEGLFKKKYDLLFNNCKNLSATVYNYLKSEGRNCIIGIEGAVIFADLP